MLKQQDLTNAITNCVDNVDIAGLGKRIQGKVRDIYSLGDKRLLITTDRISAFDRVLGLIPYKGQVLNQLSAWWFEQTSDIVKNHMLSVPDPNVMLVKEAKTLPVEVVVRGYITGVTSTSLWTMYAAGEREPYGIRLPNGLKKNDRLPEPIITPTTKAEHGHDEAITSKQIVEQGLVDAEIWAEVQEKAIAVFKRGQALADKAGLILVDTKYEFGLIDGKIALIDEIHTPDSSRYWTKASYAIGNPENISKEFLREWFKAQGYIGEGEPPKMSKEFVTEVASRYIEAYESITGQSFIAGEQPATSRIQANLMEFKA
jgi:phosphoribosylaminoimidazole-succinocarboxamide synthase